MAGPWLPPRRHASFVDHAHQRESPEQLVSKLHVHLRRQHWRGLHHLLLLLKFMAKCNPALASQLSAAGGVTALLAVVHSVLAARPPPKSTELLLTAAMSLLNTVATADLNSAAKVMVHDAPVHTLTTSCTDSMRSKAGLLVRIMCDIHSGARARRKAAQLLRSLVDAGQQFELVKNGLLRELPSVLSSPVTSCDFVLLQDVLWSLMVLVDSEVEVQGQVQHPQPIMRALLPLLYALCDSRSLHLRLLLAAALRILYVVVVNDAAAKEQLQHLGIMDCLVHVICSDCLAQSEPQSLDAQCALPIATAAISRGRSSGGAGDRLTLSSSQSPFSKMAQGCDLQSPPGSQEAWLRLCAAALMGPVLDQIQFAHADGGMAENGGSSGAELGSHAREEERSGGISVSASAVCTYGLLLPLQRPDTSPGASGQKWLSPIKEAFKGLLVMLCADDVNAQWLNDHIIVRAGPALVHLVATGDMELAWQAANTLGHLATSPHCTSLLAHGIIEELTFFLQESADALHALTVQRQVEEHSIIGVSSTQLPIPHSAYAYQGRELAKQTKDRVRLVGRQPVTVNESWCMYGSHAPTAMCDYCVPSACLRALLRLMALPAHSPSPQSTAVANGSSSSNSTNVGPAARSCSNRGRPDEDQTNKVRSGANHDVAHRFTSSGGLYALFLLLHHELCGVHPSKMASSLLTLLNMVLDTSATYKDEVRKVGGLGLLTALMGSLAKSDRVTDIFQLRVRICHTLQCVLDGNQANKLLAREHGLLEPLVMTLRHAVCPDANQVSVLDDAEQVTVSTLDLLSTAVNDSRGNQAAFIATGGLPLLHDLLMKPNISPSVLLAVVHVFELLVQGCEPAKLAMLGTPALPHLVSVSNNAPASPLAQCVVALCCRLVSVHPQGKAKVLASGVLPLLLRMLHTRPYGAHTGAASQGLYAITLGDVDLQNEVAAQNGFHAIEDIIRNSPSLCSHALWLLCCLIYGNSYMKNEARLSGLIKLLMDLVKANGIAQPDITVPALHALGQMCQSNSANQRAVVEEGGMGLVCSFMQRILDAGGGADAAKGSSASVAVAQGGMASAMKHPAVLDAVLRLLGSLVEFNAQNQSLARESGCLARIADLLMLAAEVHDLDTLRAAQLFPAVSAACAAVARAAQDCEANQRWLVHWHEDLAAALFRLLSIEDPYVALDASRALEFVAIRSDQVSAGEDRAEFEADAVRTIVRIMHSRGPARTHAASVAAAAAVLGGKGGGAGSSALAGSGGSGSGLNAKEGPGGLSVGKLQVTSYTLQEAARVLHSILDAVPSAQALAKAQLNAPAIPARKREGLLRRFTRAGRQASPTLHPIHATTASSADTTTAHTSTDKVSNISTAARPDSSASGGSSSPVSPPPPELSLVSLSSLSPDPKAGPHGWGMGRGGPHFSATRQPTYFRQMSHGKQQQGQAGAQVQPLGQQGQGHEHHGQKHLQPAGQQGSQQQQQQQQQQGGTHASQKGDSSHPEQSKAEGTVNCGKSRRQSSEGGHLSATTARFSPVKSERLMCIEKWTKCSGCSTAGFQVVATNIGPGPWHYVKLQLAWVLFLLAAKAPANRDLIEHLLRTMVTPLAQQLANVEAFYASDEAFAALMMGSPVDCPPAPLPLSTIASDQQQQQQQRRQQQQLHHRQQSLKQQQQSPHVASHQGQHLAALATSQQQQSAHSNSCVPSAPCPYPLHQVPANGGGFAGMSMPDGSGSDSSSSSASKVPYSGVSAGATNGVGSEIKGQKGEGRDVAHSDAPAMSMGDDELRLIEAEVAMLANFGSAHRSPAAAAVNES